MPSPSSRRAWIEISDGLQPYRHPAVALLAEGVDRNSYSTFVRDPAGRVALLAEGVDRNPTGCASNNSPGGSPSSRRAWIEILSPPPSPHPPPVALLAEGVDRNSYSTFVRDPAGRSPSSRRAWIEIIPSVRHDLARMVALLAEGVDRNLKTFCHKLPDFSRPPRGGRG